MNAIRFKRKIEKRIGRQLHKLLRRVAKRDRRNALADVWLVLEGDCGGQIYLSIPWLCVGKKARISELLREMDLQAWGGCAIYSVGAGLRRPRTDEEMKLILQKAELSLEQATNAYGFDTTERFLEANRMHISGGMGGGWLQKDRAWMHDEFLKGTGWAARVLDLLDIAKPTA